ncbi:TITAN protein [Salix suchowensis]|nr:TITAN protein [Salix suchowensis]
MHKNIRLSFFPVPCHHSGSINGSHSPWCLFIVPCRCINHDQVPLYLVNFTRQTFQGKLAHGELWITDCCALRSLAYLHEIAGLIHLAVIWNMIGL